MSHQQEGTTRKEFMAAGAVGAALAAGAFGFVRTASAQEQAGAITQLASFKLVAGGEDEAVAALQELTKAVEANEPGVLAYVCYRSEKDASQVIFFEIYKDQAALAAHGQTEHLGKLRAGMGKLFAPPVEITRLTRVGGFIR